MFDNQTPPLKTVLIAIDRDSRSLWPAQESVAELAELAKTAGVDVQATIIQPRPQPDRTSYLGSGKLEGLKQLVTENDFQLVIADDELTPSQHKYIEKFLEIKILDRTSLILDIFSQRAQTYEAKLQIEVAQLDYLLPRLTRLWTHLSRQGGGIGSRGPGETQLETDKQQITKRMSLLKEKLKKVQESRHIQRAQRQSLPLLTCALIGYTNSGKSTLMNRLTQAGVLSENKLFATLDPTSRQCRLPNGGESFILTDTVGFIQKLPHHLVKAFYSTLEEVTEANILIHVIDASHPQLERVIQTSLSLIQSLKAENTPVLYVFNKWDLVQKPNHVKKLIEPYQPHVCVSTLHDGDFSPFFNALSALIEPFKTRLHFHIPYARMDVVHLLHQYGTIISEEFNETVDIEVSINKVIGSKILNMLT